MRPKYGSNFSNNENFKRTIPGRNNHNASKLIEKYDNLAREALSNGDKILSENYLQHADHFTRILNEQETLKKLRYSESSSLEKKDDQVDEVTISEKKVDEDIIDKKEIKSVAAK